MAEFNTTTENTQTEQQVDTAQAGQAGTEQGTKGQQQTLTMEEVARLVQSEADKRVTAALNKQRKEYEKKLSLSSLSEAERQSAEKDQRIAELTEQLTELNSFKARSAVMDEMAKRNLPVALADVILVEGDPEKAEDNLKRIGALEEAFRKGVEEGVKQQLAGKGAPRIGVPAAQMTRNEYLKLSLAEKARLAQENPELYNKLNE